MYAAPCSPSLRWDVTPPSSSHLPAHGCPTVGASLPPLIPLACRLEAWLFLPNPSRWLIRTVRGILFTSVHSDIGASVLRAEIVVLLAKDAIEPVPPAKMKSGFYSPYFIILKKNGGLRPILDLRVLNRSLCKMPFKMLTPKCIISCIRHQDWFTAIDLKDAYFLVSICLDTDHFFGLPLRLTREICCASSGIWCFSTSVFLELRVNWEKSKLSPRAEHLFSRDGAGFGQHDGVPHGRACAVGAQLSELIQTQHGGPSKEFSEAPGAHGSCSHGHAARLASYEAETEPCSRCTLTPAYSPWRMATPSPSGPAYLELIRGGSDRPMPSHTAGLTKYAFPPVGLLAQTLCKILEDEKQVLLIAPYWPTRTWFPELP
ncbi:Endogenous retrovirus group K member 9 Pol protein [Labeo rohita]|uniref:Endogenous retrovirus group K member 9 Pol protein n=1 Tax=Labeo rohita TaxID=84645 RepID=A0ABQ8L9Z1_LABRO|nr:Endogenous retrovirus group K member 9 Pol protein [Labeo rohita]